MADRAPNYQAITKDLAESMLDLTGYLNTDILPNPQNITSEQLASFFGEADKKRFAEIYGLIARIAGRIEQELRK